MRAKYDVAAEMERMSEVGPYRHSNYRHQLCIGIVDDEDLWLWVVSRNFDVNSNKPVWCFIWWDGDKYSEEHRVNDIEDHFVDPLKPTDDERILYDLTYNIGYPL